MYFLWLVSNKIIQISNYLKCIYVASCFCWAWFMSFFHVFLIWLFTRYSVWKFSSRHNLRPKVLFSLRENILFSAVRHQRALVVQDQLWRLVSVPRFTRSYFQSKKDFHLSLLTSSSWLIHVLSAYWFAERVTLPLHWQRLLR